VSGGKTSGKEIDALLQMSEESEHGVSGLLLRKGHFGGLAWRVEVAEMTRRVGVD
jgi:hypothetical protein